jgi:hypothetical protein
MIRLIKSGRVKWAEHVACMGKMKNNTKLCLESLKARDVSEDFGIGGRIILKWFLKNRVGGCGLDRSGGLL